MLKELKFVRGAVAKKDFVPAMTHFAIEGGHVRSYNGMLALSSPIPFDIDCKPKAGPLISAIANCDETVQLSLTPAGRLKVQSGNFKAFIECSQDEATPHVTPTGQMIEVDGEALLRALHVVEPFIGNDASRQWTNGVMLSDCSAFATNNVCLIEYWIGIKFPRVVNVPRVAVVEILRIDEPPVSIQLDENSISFHYADGRWIRSTLFSTEWPDLTTIFERPCNPQPLDHELFKGLEVIKPFTDKLGRVYVKENGLNTSLEATEGASYDMQNCHEGIYQIEMLSLLAGCVTHIDWSLWPAPCLFFGKGLRGAIIGMKQ